MSKGTHLPNLISHVNWYPHTQSILTWQSVPTYPTYSQISMVPIYQTYSHMSIGTQPFLTCQLVSIYSIYFRIAVGIHRPTKKCLFSKVFLILYPIYSYMSIGTHLTNLFTHVNWYPSNKPIITLLHVNWYTPTQSILTWLLLPTYQPIQTHQLVPIQLINYYISIDTDLPNLFSHVNWYPTTQIILTCQLVPIHPPFLKGIYWQFVTLLLNIIFEKLLKWLDINEL